MKLISCLILCCLLISCSKSSEQETRAVPVAQQFSEAKTLNGDYISWKEHIIDDTNSSGVDLSGSDGLSIGDLDNDGHLDIVSVHESDTEYDGALEGHIRIAFGSADPNIWESITLASGNDAAAAEDVAIDDINGDGFLDVVAACELGHLIYFQNPTTNIRSHQWRRIIPNITQNRGSFIRVFTADFNKDGRPEIVAANKGGQLGAGNHDDSVSNSNPVSYFEITGDPLRQESWNEHELIRVVIPINARPVDLDNDGDLDVIAGSRGENKINLFKNRSKDSIHFEQFSITITESSQTRANRNNLEKRALEVNGFNMDFLDVNDDGRLDILLVAIDDEFPIGSDLMWLEQPEDWSSNWTAHYIGTTRPDRLVGLAVADINDDGKLDVMTGGYSRGNRRTDKGITVSDPLGRLAWFEHPKDPNKPWPRHDISRRKRGMFDKFIAIDLDQDGDQDFLSTRGNSLPYDGVFWLEQVRTKHLVASFKGARTNDSEEMPLSK